MNIQIEPGQIHPYTHHFPLIMNSNALSVCATCIVIGLGGFMLGKLTSGKAEQSGHDHLLERSNRQIDQRSVSRDRDNVQRSRQLRSNSITEQKLAKVDEIARCENVYERGRAMLEWIESLAPEEFEAAAASLRRADLSDYQMGEYAMMLLTAWAEVDPVTALAHAEKNFSKVPAECRPAEKTPLRSLPTEISLQFQQAETFAGSTPPVTKPLAQF